MNRESRNDGQLKLSVDVQNAAHHQRAAAQDPCTFKATVSRASDPAQLTSGMFTESRFISSRAKSVLTGELNHEVEVVKRLQKQSYLDLTAPGSRLRELPVEARGASRHHLTTSTCRGPSFYPCERPRVLAWAIITALRRHGPMTVHELADCLPVDAGLDLPAVRSALIQLMEQGLAVLMRRGRTASGFPSRVWRVAEPHEVVSHGVRSQPQVQTQPPE